MSRFIMPIEQVALSDFSGPGSGWQLYFYESETSTPKDTYADSDLSTVSTTNSSGAVEADSAGRFPAIFLESGLYKVILKDSDDVTIWSADPVDGGSGNTGVVDEISADYTVTISDATKLLNVSASGAARTITLPASATAGDGFEITFKKSDDSANTVTVDGNGSETIDGATTFVLRGQYDWVTIRCDGSNWQIVARGRSTVTQAVAEAGTSTVPYEWTPQRISQAIAALGGLPKAYLTGLQLANGTDSDHDIDVTAGECRDSADAADIVLSAITKQIDATWAAGTDAGGLSSSLSAPANNTWYHVFAIIVGGSADVGFDTSVTAANLVTDHSATAYRRIGAVLTDGSANIIAFIQFGDLFLWSVPKSDYVATNPGTSAVTVALDYVPTGVRVQADITFGHAHDTNYAGILITAMDQADTVPTGPTERAAPIQTIGEDQGGSNWVTEAMRVLTDTSAQIRYRLSVSGASDDVHIMVNGWLDTRGKD